MKRYQFTDVVNLRDLGGYPVSLNKYTKFGRILRSDAPLKITNDEKQFLLDMNIKTIIDLRSKRETIQSPSVFESLKEFNYHNFQFISAETVWRTEDDIPVFYTDLSNELVMAEIMKTIAASDSGVLIHCAAGKDRTGVVSALLLLLAGVSKLDVFVDYQITSTYLIEKVKGLLKDHPDLPAFVLKSDISFMEAFLAAFFTTHNSVFEYFKKYLQLTDMEIDDLKGKLLND